MITFFAPVFAIAVGLGLSARIVWLRTHGEAVPLFLTTGRTVVWVTTGMSVAYAVTQATAS